MKSLIKSGIRKHSELLVKLNILFGRFFMLDRHETWQVNKDINGSRIYQYKELRCYKW